MSKKNELVRIIIKFSILLVIFSFLFFIGCSLKRPSTSYTFSPLNNSKNNSINQKIEFTMKKYWEDDLYPYTKHHEYVTDNKHKTIYLKIFETSEECQNFEKNLKKDITKIFDPIKDAVEGYWTKRRFIYEKSDSYKMGSIVCVKIPKEIADCDGGPDNDKYPKLDHGDLYFYFYIQTYRPCIDNIKVGDKSIFTGTEPVSRYDAVTIDFNSNMVTGWKDENNNLKRSSFNIQYQDDNQADVEKTITVYENSIIFEEDTTSGPYKAMWQESPIKVVNKVTHKLALNNTPYLPNGKTVLIKIPIDAFHWAEDPSVKLGERSGPVTGPYLTYKFVTEYDPRVKSTYPIDQYEYFDAEKESILINFNAPMETSKNKFYVKKGTEYYNNNYATSFTSSDIVTGEITGSYPESNRTLRYTPQFSNFYNKWIYVCIPKNTNALYDGWPVELASMTPLQNNYYFAFKTAPYLCILPDKIEPKVNSTNNDKFVVIRIPFNRPMNTNNTTFKIKIGANSSTYFNVTGEWENNNQDLVFRFLSCDFDNVYNKEITVWIEKNKFQDSSGTYSYNQDYTFKFTMGNNNYYPSTNCKVSKLSILTKDNNDTRDRNILNNTTKYASSKRGSTYYYSYSNEFTYNILPCSKEINKSYGYWNNYNDFFDCQWIDGRQDKKSRIFEIEFPTIPYGSYIEDFQDIGIYGLKDPIITNTSNLNIDLYAVFDGNITDISTPGKTYLFINKDKKLTLYAYGQYTTKFYTSYYNAPSFGDDFVINFKVNDGINSEKYNFYSQTQSDKTKIDQFLGFFGAFDEKLIYEAEMYIDDDVDVNIEQKPKNEYNIKPDGTTAQVDIMPFTYIPDIGGNEKGAVAYSLGCQDTYTRFNNEMNQQRSILNKYISNGLREYKSNGGWSKTTAPGNTFMKNDYQRDDDYYTYAIPRKEDGTKDSNIPVNCYLTINGINYLLFNNPGNIDISSTYGFEGEFPYLPGWSLQQKNDSHFYVNAISTGIDCLGFVMRACQYSGNPYYGHAWQNTLQDHLPNGNWEGVGTTGRNHPSRDKSFVYSIEITASDINSSFENLGAVVPGDIFYIRFDDDPISEHVAIVRSVKFTGNIRTIDLANVKLIEATTDYSISKTWAKVIKNRYSVEYYDSVSPLVYWHIVRLRTN